VWVVWGYVVGGTLYNTTMHNKYKKYCTIHNTDTVEYATHSGSTHWYTTINMVHNVHNTYMTQKHLGYLKVKLLQFSINFV